MNTYSHSIFGSRGWRLAGAILGAAALGWTAAAFASNQDDDTAKVIVQVDPSPIDRDENGGLRVSFSPVVKKVSPSVVQVHVTARAQRVSSNNLPPFLRDPRLRDFFGIPEQGTPRSMPRQQGTGSGVIVSEDGYILTNHHVVENADEILVTMSDRRELHAKVVGNDPESDLAVIKVDETDLPAITFADSEAIEIGDTVLAVGNPFGLGQTVTSGMVSALGRASLGLAYEDFIQTDAAINPGNSGGALVDVNGRLVGINTAILSRTGGFQGIGFAIPANLARNVMQQLATNGKVIRGYLGVQIGDLAPDQAEFFDLEETDQGALISEVVDDSPADESGLRHNDVIVEFDGRPVTGARQLKLAVGDVRPGSEVEAVIIRDGKRKTLDIAIGARPGEEMLAANLDGEGLHDEGTLNGVGVADLDSRVRRQMRVPERLEGAVVTHVDPESASARAGLQPGDVITEINREPVEGADDAVRLTETSRESKRTLVRVWKPRGGIRYIVVDESETSAG